LSTLLERYQWRDLIAGRYVRTASRRDRIRCSEVADFVAESLGIAVSPMVRIRARQAAALAGWRLVVRPQRVAMYTNMRLRP
jgi:hypothetical protein